MKPKPVTALSTIEPEAVEVMTGDPLFDRARKLFESVKASSRKSHEDKEEFGAVLLAIKTRLGFTVPGPKNCQQIAGDSNCPQVAVNCPHSTWGQWTRAELRCSDDTADRFIAYAEAFRMLREAIGEESPVLQALRRPFELLGGAERKAIHQAVKDMQNGKHRQCLMTVFGIKPPPHVLTGGDTSAFRKPSFFDDPTPDQAASFLKVAFGAFYKAANVIRQHRGRTDIDPWLALVPFVSADITKGMGLMDYQHQMAQLIAEAIADLEDIGVKLAKFVEARTEGAHATAKQSRRAKKTPHRK